MSALPLFVELAGRAVTVVGGGPVAAEKALGLCTAGAHVTLVAPEMCPAVAPLALERRLRGFEPSDLDGAWLVVAAATPAVNTAVRAAADARRIFCVAVDDPARCSAFGAARVRRGGVELAIATGGEAPALAALLRELLEELVPEEVGRWHELARETRRAHKRDGVPFAARKGLLATRLIALYGSQANTNTPLAQRERGP